MRSSWSSFPRKREPSLCAGMLDSGSPLRSGRNDEGESALGKRPRRREEGGDAARILDAGRALDAGGDVDRRGAGDAHRLGEVAGIEAARQHPGEAPASPGEELPVEGEAV